MPTMALEPGATNSSGGYVASIAKVTCPVLATEAGTSAATEASLACSGICLVGKVVVVADEPAVVVVELLDELEEQAAPSSATESTVAPTSPLLMR